MANVLAVLFICACVGLALWGTIKGHAFSCSECSGDCGTCGSHCTTKKKLKLSRKQIAEIEAAKAAVAKDGDAA